MLFILILSGLFSGYPCAQSADIDWPGALGGTDSNQYSSLTEIHPGNVGTLQVAWTYHAGGKSDRDRSQIQCNPIVLDGVLYATSPDMKLFALDAATGVERWVFDPSKRGGRVRAGGVNRGVMYWEDGSEKRILYAAGQNLYAVDAVTGGQISTFGAGGRVDLRTGLGEHASNLYVLSNSPGVVYKDLVILGTRVSEGLPSAPGHIRAFDVRTGELAWIFHTIPQPGEFGHDTWPAGAWKTAGGANSWAGMSLDAERGIVYVPTGSAAYDFYGGDRAGQNLFANCLLALNAGTGERIWHFQTVHHDLWDRDIPAPPNLVTVLHGGKRIDAVAQITKSAHVFLFDRDTGEPLFPIEERAVPPSDLKGEAAWPTQPVPVKPPPFSRESFTEREATNISPESNAYVLDRLRRLRTGRQFIPPSEQGTIVLPGFDGGGEWGGAAVDPQTGIMYVNASEMPWLLQMIYIGSGRGKRQSRTAKMTYARNCLYCHGVDRKGDPLEIYPSLLDLPQRLSRREAKRIIEEGQGQMPSFRHLGEKNLRSLVSYLYGANEAPSDEDGDSRGPDIPYVHTGYIRFVDQDGYPAIKPPWGTLNAIDLNKGEILWKVTLGDTPELSGRGLPPTGAENYGGPIVTAGGVIFIAATKDEKFRAFDKRSGGLIWETQLPAGGYATPSTYSVNGKQYVVIAAGGGKMGTKSGDAYIAYALP